MLLKKTKLGAKKKKKHNKNETKSPDSQGRPMTCLMSTL